MVFEDFRKRSDWYFKDVVIIRLGVKALIKTKNIVDWFIIYFRLQPKESLSLFVVIEFSLLKVKEVYSFFTKILL